MNKKPIIQAGLQANWQQFALLVLVNAFCRRYDRVGKSRVAWPWKECFGLDANTAIELNNVLKSLKYEKTNPFFPPFILRCHFFL